jgi:molybdate transport system regulatory protein
MPPRTVTDTDVALLRSLATERSVVAASRQVGISRDRATYRIARLERAFGGPVVTSQRGGGGHGGTRLTALGDRIVRQGFDAIELLEARAISPRSRANALTGTYRAGPAPEVDLGRGIRLKVAFSAEDGERVTVHQDPESVLVARGRFPSSARNVVRATVDAVRSLRRPGGSMVVVRVGGHRWRVAVTAEAIRALPLKKGVRVWLYVKATALRRGGRATRRPTP